MVLLAYLLLIIVVSALHHARRAGAYVRDVFTAPFSTKFGEFDREDRLRRLENGLSSERARFFLCLVEATRQVSAGKTAREMTTRLMRRMARALTVPLEMRG